MSIQWKIIGIYLNVVLVIMIASGSVIVLRIEEQYYNRLRVEIESMAVSIKDILYLDGEFDLQSSRDDMIHILKNLVNINENTDIYILDNNGYVEIALGKAFTIGDYIPSKHPNGFSGVVNETLISAQPSTTKWAYLSSNSTNSQNTIEHTLPLKNGSNTLKAIIYIISDTQEIYDNVETVINTLGVGTIVALALAAVFSAIFSRMITQPIKTLTKSARLLQEDTFQKIPSASNDEIGQLTQSFNQMALELRKTLVDISSEKNKLERILENLADGVLAFNRQGVLIHANSVSYDMLDKTKMDHRFDYIFPNFGVDISFDSILADESENQKAILLQHEDKFINLHFAPYESSQGEKEGLTVVMQDVTTQQKLDQMRKDFVANVSHELRTPLTTVKSYTETLINGAIDEKDMALNFLNVMDKETDRMTTLVQDLLELSRIDNKQMQLNMHVIDVEELLIETINAQTLQAEQKGHKIR
ncbi:MAG: hypothetical protein BEN19_00565, partial [Epulopiscium sp. Nuni2H_MBin003]